MVASFAIAIVADWSVRIDGAYGQSIDFSTGSDPGAAMTVELYDVCRVDSAERYYLGDLYPGNSVYGLNADQSGIVNSPGSGNKIAYSFTDTLNQTSMYRDNGDNTARVAFCVQVGLYDGNTLVNLGEIWVEYSIDLIAEVVNLATYTITDAAGYTDASDVEFAFDGSLNSYFCDPNSFNELVGDGHVMEQGSVLSVCFQVAAGQFEMADVMYLTVKSAWESEPSQDIVIDSHIVNENVALKSCIDNSNSDVNICVVQFIPKADFFETSWIELTGLGMVLLELGDSSGNRRLDVAASSEKADEPADSSGSDVDLPEDPASQKPMGVLSGHYITKPFQVKKIRIYIDGKDSSLLTTIIFIIVTIFGFAGAIALWWYFTAKKLAVDDEVDEEQGSTGDLDKPTKTAHPSLPTTVALDDSSSARKPVALGPSGSTVHRTIVEPFEGQGVVQPEDTSYSSKGKRIFDT